MAEVSSITLRVEVRVIGKRVMPIVVRCLPRRVALALLRAWAGRCFYYRAGFDIEGASPRSRWVRLPMGKAF